MPAAIISWCELPPCCCERIRDIDRIARWGGEEFILLLPETDEAAAGALAEKLRVAVSENYFEYEDKRLALP